MNTGGGDKSKKEQSAMQASIGSSLKNHGRRLRETVPAAQPFMSSRISTCGKSVEADRTRSWQRAGKAGANGELCSVS